jgi:Macrocin-O-methyltransferase (TylF)
MIKMPDFATQSAYDYETFFHLTLRVDRLAKFIVHYEAYKMVLDIPGAIVECGVFKGTSFVRFAMMRELLGNYFSNKLIAFDVFSDQYPDTKFAEDKAYRDHWINTAGPSSISTEQLDEVLKRQDVKNYELIAGDVLETVPKYIAEHPGLKVALLNLDIDFVEPTKCVLEHFWDRVMPGGIVLLDNYAGEDAGGNSLHGDTKGIDDFFADKDVLIQKFPFASRPCFVVKE